LEKQYTVDMEEQQCVRLAIQALLEVVDSGAKTMEVCVVKEGGKKVIMTEEEVDVICKEIEAEAEEKRAPAGAGDE
jgi:20S proteasome subunit alpha 4